MKKYNQITKYMGEHFHTGTSRIMFLKGVATLFSFYSTGSMKLESKTIEFYIRISLRNRCHIRKSFTMPIRSPVGLVFRKKVGGNNLMTLSLKSVKSFNLNN